jgi:hypothetical protein
VDKERKKLSDRLLRENTICATVASRELLDYLNCTFRTLSFACSADKAFVNVDRNGFAVFDFVDAYWASVCAGFASGALFIINHYFYHVYYLL